MKRFLAVVVALSILTTWYFATQGSGRAITVVTGSPRHIVTLTLGTPRTGERTVTLRVTDRAGTPCRAAALPFTAVLPTMGYSTPVMSAVAGRTAGSFTVDALPLMAPGGWQLRVTVPDPAGEEQVMVPVPVTG